MSETVAVALISGVPATILAIATLVKVLRRLDELDAKVEVVHKATNGMAAAIGAAEHAKGKLEGVQEEKDRTA